MSFADTYGHEVLESRRTRSQRAGFWAKLVSLMLMVLVAVTLRSEPELRRALIEASITAGMQITGRAAPQTRSTGAGTFVSAAPATSAPPRSSTGLRDRIKVNRPTSGNTLPGGSGQGQIDALGIAQGLQGGLSSFDANGG